MNTINVKLYDILRHDFKLPDDKAKGFAEAINEIASESTAMAEFKSTVKEDLLKLELKLTSELATTKNELVRWMFTFWIGTIGIAILFYFLKK